MTAPRPEEWTPQQRRVIEADSSARLLVEAGPGTGKTTVACARVAYLLDNYTEPASIWLVSFTRTAVKELRDRIQALASSIDAAAAVRITTIDSHAWQLRQGFAPTDNRQPFRSYQQSIEDALKMLQRPSPDLIDFLASIQHIIVDEAQDVIGVRRDLIMELLRGLPSNCGITVFCDSAQAIYGFGEDDEDEPAAGDPLVALLRCDSSLGFASLELTEVKRTKNAALRRIFTETRGLVLNGGKDAMAKVLRSIAANADAEVPPFVTDQKLQGRSDVLVLFRRRAEVLFSGSFLAGDGSSFRVRMSGVPVCLDHLWATLFWDCTSHNLTKEEFDSRWSRLNGRTTSERNVSWALLVRYSGKTSSSISMKVLRALLSRSQPPLEFVVPDLGRTGPILSTIHASKGRESDVVHLMLGSNGEGNDEEVRVLYVGATRARRELHLGRAHGLGAGRLPSGRVYRLVFKKGQVGAQVELGRAGDVDEIGQVSKVLEPEANRVHAVQRRLSEIIDTPTPVRSKSKPFGSRWIRLLEEGSECLGYFADHVSKDIWAVAQTEWKGRGNTRYKPWSAINNIYLIGARSVVRSVDDPDLAQLHEPYASSGFYLVPVLFGFPKVSFEKY